ncbi:MAG TPA: biopolymer transporter ExbD [Myxococcales bacterium]|nr:biopolymer transporter ExbD [Myxococcales bacterium]
MAMAVGAGKGPRSDINITPLVDVVLVLLIIFMVLTPLMEKEIGVRVPEEVPPEMLNEPPPPDLTQIVFKVDESGIWHLNNETLTDQTAVDRLKAYYRLAKSKEATQGPPVIFFDADDKTKYVRAVKALDTIRDSSSGWTIGMMTESIKEQAQPGATPGQPGAAPGQPGATPGQPGAAPAPGATPEPPK